MNFVYSFRAYFSCQENCIHLKPNKIRKNSKISNNQRKKINKTMKMFYKRIFRKLFKVLVTIYCKFQIFTLIYNSVTTRKTKSIVTETTVFCKKKTFLSLYSPKTYQEYQQKKKKKKLFNKTTRQLIQLASTDVKTKYPLMEDQSLRLEIRKKKKKTRFLQSRISFFRVHSFTIRIRELTD